MMRSRVCALTGHRLLPPRFETNRLYDCLEKLIGDNCNYFLCGMAQGFDLLALECLVSLRQKHKLILEACIPYEGHENNLSLCERRKYAELLSWCDRKTVLFEQYRKGCFLARDRYMVDCCDVVLAYCIKETGGTAYTVNYAKKKNIPVIFVENGGN